MWNALIGGAAIAVCLGASMLLWGQQPSRRRLALATAIGIVAAVLAWMLVGNALTIPDSAGAALGVWLLVLSVALVRFGVERERRDPA